MKQDKTHEQDKRAVEAVEVEAESPESELPNVTPQTAPTMLGAPMAAAQRQAVVRSVGQQFGNQTVQRVLGVSRSSGLEGGELEGDIASTIQAERSKGQPLDKSVRDKLEPALGHDLSPVRLHTDSTAQTLSRQVGAKAFTTGRDIFIGAGQSPTDMHLLAHEATHTIQQGFSEAPPSSIGSADTQHEHQAEHQAANLNSAAGGVQREANEEELQLMREADEEELQLMRVGLEDEEEMQA